MSLHRIQIYVLAFAGLLLMPYNSQGQDALNEKHMEVTLRMIGHQVLLSAGDSTSRVLPIIEDEGQYRIQFESELAIVPDDLVTIVKRVVSESSIASSYIVEVEECTSMEVVYSFELSALNQSDMAPCRSRSLPNSCYSLLFTSLEGGQAKAESVVVLSNGLFAKSGSHSSMIALFVLLFGGGLFFIWKKRRKSPIDPNLIVLGNYHFDKRNTALLIQDQTIELTGKEAELLLLLYKDANTTVEREFILKKVWGDDGDYVGRTLDVFISKLRKKLEFDAKVKILNIRGVGYKLVVDI